MRTLPAMQNRMLKKSHRRENVGVNNFYGIKFALFANFEAKSWKNGSKKLKKHIFYKLVF
jgi:hypothetical protein